MNKHYALRSANACLVQGVDVYYQNQTANK